MAAYRETRHDHLRRAARLQVAVAVGKADDGIGVADIHPFGIWSRRIERDAKWTEKTVSEHGRLRGLFTVRPQNADTPGRALCSEHVAIRRHADEARGRQPRGEQTNFKSLRHMGLLHFGARDGPDAIWYRRRRIWSRQVRWRDKTSRSRTVSMPIAECCLALKCGAARLGRRPLAGAEKERHARGGNNRRDRMRHRALLANVRTLCCVNKLRLAVFHYSGPLLWPRQR